MRKELAEHPSIAYLALLHALVLDTFFTFGEASHLESTAKRALLSTHAPGIDESLAEKESAQRHAE